MLFPRGRACRCVFCLSSHLFSPVIPGLAGLWNIPYPAPLWPALQPFHYKTSQARVSNRTTVHIEVDTLAWSKALRWTENQTPRLLCLSGPWRLDISHPPRNGSWNCPVEEISSQWYCLKCFALSSEWKQKYSAEVICNAVKLFCRLLEIGGFGGEVFLSSCAQCGRHSRLAEHKQSWREFTWSDLKALQSNGNKQTKKKADDLDKVVFILLTIAAVLLAKLICFVISDLSLHAEMILWLQVVIASILVTQTPSGVPM